MSREIHGISYGSGNVFYSHNYVQKKYTRGTDKKNCFEKSGRNPST